MQELQSRYKASVEGIIISNMIPYRVLNELTISEFANSDATGLNIYIDLYHIFRDFYKNNMLLIAKHDLVAYITNLVGHYRDFYRRYFGVHTKIFLIYTTGYFPTAVEELPTYNQNSLNDYDMAIGIKEYLEHNMYVLNILCKYLPDVYFIEAPVDPSVSIYSIMNDEFASGNYNPNIILSRSVMNHQLIPISMTQTVQIKHLYRFGELECKAINIDNCILEYIDSLKRSISEPELIGTIPRDALSLIMALLGVKQRSVSGTGIRTDKIIKVVPQFLAHKRTNYISSFADIAELCQLLNKNLDPNKVFSNFKAVDVLHQYNKYILAGKPVEDIRWNVNLIDPDMVKSLNNKYFSNHPLDLTRL